MGSIETKCYKAVFGALDDVGLIGTLVRWIGTASALKKMYQTDFFASASIQMEMFNRTPFAKGLKNSNRTKKALIIHKKEDLLLHFKAHLSAQKNCTLTVLV